MQKGRTASGMTAVNIRNWGASSHGSDHAQPRSGASETSISSVTQTVILPEIPRGCRSGGPEPLKLGHAQPSTTLDEHSVTQTRLDKPARHGVMEREAMIACDGQARRKIAAMTCARLFHASGPRSLSDRGCLSPQPVIPCRIPSMPSARWFHARSRVLSPGVQMSAAAESGCAPPRPVVSSVSASSSPVSGWWGRAGALAARVHRRAMLKRVHYRRSGMSRRSRVGFHCITS